MNPNRPPQQYPASTEEPTPQQVRREWIKAGLLRTLREVFVFCAGFTAFEAVARLLGWRK